jgi:DMSO/TMAO reductase YedYZ molybdopterin-dependent catalytic subunit
MLTPRLTARALRSSRALRALMVSAALVSLSAWPSAYAQTATGPSELKIGGTIQTPLLLTAADLKQLPRKTISVKNSHNQKTEVYEGIPLADLLNKAGAPQGAKLRGDSLTMYVVAEGADGYLVVFSLAELDPGFLDSSVLVADTLDGAPLAAGEGPFKLVAPSEKVPARWVRMLKSLTVVRAPNP